MEYLIHLLFELFKISILSVFYTTIIFILFRLLSKKYPDNKLINQINNLKKFIVKTYLLIYGLLFIFLFSYYGNHGLGDYARIPIGYGKSVEQINSSIDYISIENSPEMFKIGRFDIKKNYLVADLEYNNTNEKENGYIVWNLKSDKLFRINSLSELNEYNINEDDLEFEYFDDKYDSYWSNWRFFLLP